MIRSTKQLQQLQQRRTSTTSILIACGGSQAFMMPAQFMFDKEIDIPAGIYTSNQFVHEEPKALGPDSVVITCSHSGNTPETVKWQQRLQEPKEQQPSHYPI